MCVDKEARLETVGKNGKRRKAAPTAVPLVELHRSKEEERYFLRKRQVLQETMNLLQVTPSMNLRSHSRLQPYKVAVEEK